MKRGFDLRRHGTRWTRIAGEVVPGALGPVRRHRSLRQGHLLVDPDPWRMLGSIIQAPRYPSSRALGLSLVVTGPLRGLQASV